MFTAQRTLSMLGNAEVWDAAVRVHEVLALADVPHALVGGVAVCLHGYRRNTIDVDWLVRPQDQESIQTALTESGFTFDAARKEFTTADGIAVQFVLSGMKQGPGQLAVFPEPDDAVTMIEDLPVLTLAALIQSKLACGLGNLRRTHKDFADVVELIAVHNLNGSFARKLHESVRAEFKELVRRARS